MNEAAKSLAQMKKANKLVRLAFRKNGPKSFKRGQGALLQALLVDDGATQRDLTKTLGMNRSNLKDIVKKAERNGYVTIESIDQPRTYAVKLTDLGRELAEKRVACLLVIFLYIDRHKTIEGQFGCCQGEDIVSCHHLHGGCSIHSRLHAACGETLPDQLV